MTQAVLILSGLALVSFFVRGAVGAANSIVFNALFVSLFALGLAGTLTLQDGLYWLALCNGLAAVLMFGTLARNIRFETLTLRYLMGSVPVNITFTVLLTRWGNSTLLAAFLALTVTLSGIYMAARPRLPPASTDTLNRLAFPVGLVAGVLSGLYGMAGPVALLIFGRSTNDPSTFRLRLTLVSGISTLIRLVTLTTQGVYTAERLTVAAWTVPAVVIGIGAGMWVHKYLRPGPFKMLLGVLVAVSGALALIQEGLALLR